jgi:hypothetical protein
MSQSPVANKQRTCVQATCRLTIWRYSRNSPHAAPGDPEAAEGMSSEELERLRSSGYIESIADGLEASPAMIEPARVDLSIVSRRDRSNLWKPPHGTNLPTG